MRRYDVPRLAFINKCDRSGADPIRVLNQMRDKLKLNCSPVQLPLGIEDKLRGLVDVIEQRAYNFGGPFGNEITEVSNMSCCNGPSFWLCQHVLLIACSTISPLPLLLCLASQHQYRQPV